MDTNVLDKLKLFGNGVYVVSTKKNSCTKAEEKEGRKLFFFLVFLFETRKKFKN